MTIQPGTGGSISAIDFSQAPSADIEKSFINNMIASNYSSSTPVVCSAYLSSLPFGISYSTGYLLADLTSYFSGMKQGDGCIDFPGVDPKYINNTTPPYDYHFQPGSILEYGDPNFVDWDDTGAASGNPAEPNIQNRSRVGCFGGPDGNWDPNNL